MTEKTEQIMVNDREEAGALLERDSSYLAIIGEHYGADIFARGNLIRLKGEEEAVDQSMRVIGRLRRMIRQRIRLSARQVRMVMSLLDEGKEQLLEDMEDDIINFTKQGAPLRPRTVGQKIYVDTIRHHSITFGIGPAGTGKTYLAVALAAFALRNHDVQRIILVRPAVEAGEKLGFRKTSCGCSRRAKLKSRLSPTCADARSRNPSSSLMKRRIPPSSRSKCS